MPPLKQPTSLEKMAMNVLVKYSVKFLGTCICDESLDKLREGVAFIKNEIRPRMPSTLAVDLYNKVLHKIVTLHAWHNERHFRIVSELLFDSEMTGVKFFFGMTCTLDLKDLIRIGGITELQLLRKKPHDSLAMLHLQDLTVFYCYSGCTDSDLATLSKHCPKLELVDVSWSDELTDVGLRALASCPNLHTLAVAYCPKISLSGLIRFLFLNKTVRKLFAWSDRYKPGFDYRRIRNWDLDPTVYRSIESLTIADGSSDHHLRSIVVKFPNLRSIHVGGNVTGNLSVFKSLSKLAKIDFHSDTIAEWTQFESLLECVGPQIRHLGVKYENFEDAQRGLYSIFRLCENLKSLAFRCDHGLEGEKLVVPPFEKLQHLACIFLQCPSYNGDSYDRVSNLELGQMLMLEGLLVDGFVIGVSQIKSMILGHTTYPNLKAMALSEFRHNSDFDRCKQVVKRNNLDLKLEYIE